MASVSIRDLDVSFGALTVIRRLNLEIEPGEFVVLLGPSGCGKSTVLRMIAGLEDISSGELFLDGELANHKPPGERQLAMVFQHYALYPNMTSRENIGFPLRIETPHADISPRVGEAARMLGIEDLLDRYPGQLSGGERQRVGIARALVTRPSVLLVDEPTAALDRARSDDIVALLAHETHESGVATVMVTHDHDVLGHCDRVLTMVDGRLSE